MSTAQVTHPRIPLWLFIVAGITVGGLAGGYAIGYANNAPSPWNPAIFFAVLGLVGAFGTVVAWSTNRPYTLARRVPIAPEELRRYTAWWFADAPWTLAGNDENFFVYWRRTEPLAGTVVILLLLGVVPGIIYFFLARGTQRFSIFVHPAPGGSDLQITVKPQGSEGRKRAVKFYNSLHQLVES